MYKVVKNGVVFQELFPVGTDFLGQQDWEDLLDFFQLDRLYHVHLYVPMVHLGYQVLDGSPNQDHPPPQFFFQDSLLGRLHFLMILHLQFQVMDSFLPVMSKGTIVTSRPLFTFPIWSAPYICPHLPGPPLGVLPPASQVNLAFFPRPTNSSRLTLDSQGPRSTYPHG